MQIPKRTHSGTLITEKWGRRIAERNLTYYLFAGLGVPWHSLRGDSINHDWNHRNGSLHHLHHSHPNSCITRIIYPPGLPAFNKPSCVTQTSIQAGKGDFSSANPKFQVFRSILQPLSRFTSSQCNSAIQHLFKTRLWHCKSQCHCDANVLLSRNPAPVQRSASPFLHGIALLCKSQWNSGANWHVTHPWKVTFQSSPISRAIIRARIRTLPDMCGRLRTRKQRRANTALPSDSQVKREPFATHSGKNQQALNLPYLITSGYSTQTSHINVCQVRGVHRRGECAKRLQCVGKWSIYTGYPGSFRLILGWYISPYLQESSSSPHAS